MINVQRASAGLLLALGFVMGIAFIASCGGGSGNSSEAAGGVEVIRHRVTVPAQTASSLFILSEAVFRTIYTPPDPNDLVLRVTVRGTWTTSDTSIEMSLSLGNSTGSLTYGFERILLPVATNRAFQMSTPSHGFKTIVGTGVPDGAYEILLHVGSSDPIGTSIDFGALEIEVVTLHGVTLLDPSPFL